jgi:lipooligosaccharide transport system permease protein
MATPRSLRAFEAWAVGYKRTWRGSAVSSFLSPVLFLAALGLGLGGEIDDRQAASLEGVRYLVFLAPGLLAASAMQTASGEATYPVMSAIKWAGTYKAMLASPLGVADLVLGHLGWMTARLFMVSATYVGVMAVFGAADSAGAVLAIPAAVLCGLAFAAPIMAFSAWTERDTAFASLQRFVIIPMFLFSGTFFPVDQLPAAIRPVAYATPLWHGVELCRGLALGDLDAVATLGHIAFLLAFSVAGCLLAVVYLRRRLAP